MDKESLQNQIPLSTYHQLQNSLISKLWKLKIPPKLKIFWWKILHNGLPVADNLNKRGIRNYSYCHSVRSVVKILRQCNIC